MSPKYYWPSDGSWQASNHGTGARIWFVHRPARLGEDSVGGKVYHCDRNGDLVRYTAAGACRKRDELNEQGPDTDREPDQAIEQPSRSVNRLTAKLPC